MSIPTYKDRMDVLSKIVCFYKTINKGGHIPVTAFGIIMTRRRDCDTHVRAFLRANMCRFILTIGIF